MKICPVCPIYIPSNTYSISLGRFERKLGRKHFYDTFTHNLDKKRKEVVVYTQNNQPIKATIEQTNKYKQKIKTYGKLSKAYSLNYKNKELGYMVLANSPDNDCMILYELYVNKKAQGKIKGIGTELLKAAVQESILYGHQGKIFTFAANNPPPYVFYYKNNFRPYGKNAKDLTLLLQFAAKHPDLSIKMILPNVKHMYMYLTKESAKALLEGRQLYKE